MNPSKIALTVSALLFAAAATAVTVVTPPTPAPDNRAVEIHINGLWPTVDAAAFTTVRQVIGAALANGAIDKFVVYGYGFRGGFSACAQASPGRTTGFTGFVRQLRSITPRPGTTDYSVKLVTDCETEAVFCAQDVQQCPDGSYVPRVPPSCTFAPCPPVKPGR